MWVHTKESQDKLTPKQALEFLKEGNRRFLNNLKANRNLLKQVNQTSDGQFPFATVLLPSPFRVSIFLFHHFRTRSRYEYWNPFFSSKRSSLELSIHSEKSIAGKKVSASKSS